MRTITNEQGEELEIDDDNFLVSGMLVRVELSDIIKTDLEGFLDTLARDAGLPLLTDIDYTIEGHEENSLQIRVKGDVSEELASRDE